MSLLQFNALVAALKTYVPTPCGSKRRKCEMVFKAAPDHVPYVQHTYLVHEPETNQLMSEVMDNVYCKPLGEAGEESLTGFMREGFSTQMKWAAEHGLLKIP